MRRVVVRAGEKIVEKHPLGDAPLELVYGEELFARELRESLRDRPGVQIRPIPQRGVDLDVDDVALMDAWVRQEMVRPYRRELKLRLLEAPANGPPLPESPNADEPEAPPPGVFIVY